MCAHTHARTHTHALADLHQKQNASSQTPEKGERQLRNMPLILMWASPPCPSPFFSFPSVSLRFCPNGAATQIFPFEKVSCRLRRQREKKKGSSCGVRMRFLRQMKEMRERSRGRGGVKKERKMTPPEQGSESLASQQSLTAVHWTAAHPNVNTLNATLLTESAAIVGGRLLCFFQEDGVFIPQSGEVHQARNSKPTKRKMTLFIPETIPSPPPHAPVSTTHRLCVECAEKGRYIEEKLKSKVGRVG